VGRGIALLFHDRGTGRVLVVSSMLWPHFTPGKDPVPVLHEAGWVPGPVGKSRPHRDFFYINHDFIKLSTICTMFGVYSCDDNP